MIINQYKSSESQHTCNRRGFLKTTAAVALSSAVLPLGASNKQRPNILFFLVDDLGWSDLSLSGSAFYETPHIDALAKDGLQFTQAYASAPRCVASRLSILTGKNHDRPGVRKSFDLSHDAVTFAEKLQEHKYRTFFAGKWHLGKTENDWPDSHGFDINKGGCKWGSVGKGNTEGGGKYFSPYGCPTLSDGPEGEYMTDRLTDETISFMSKQHKDNPQQPFFAYLSHYGVHTPLEAKEDDIAYFEEKLKKMKKSSRPSEIIDKTGNIKMRVKMTHDDPVYAAMIKSIDDSLGKIRTALKKIGIDKNTIIVFGSDNGGLSTTAHGSNRKLVTSNDPLRTGKGWCYEGGVREPTIVHWPGVTPVGKKTGRPVSYMDLFPTFLEMAGYPMENEKSIDGRSFVPVLRGDFGHKREPICFYYTLARVPTGNPSMAAVVDYNWKLIHNIYFDTYELYDIDKDIGEKKNLARKMPEKVKSLKSVLDEWIKRGGLAPVPKMEKMQKVHKQLIEKSRSN
jgi:arylsulfatase A-like enzyme